MPNKVMVLMVECGILDVNVVFLKDLGHPMSVVLPRAFPVYSPKAVVFMLNFGVLIQGYFTCFVHFLSITLLVWSLCHSPPGSEKLI